MQGVYGEESQGGDDGGQVVLLQDLVAGCPNHLAQVQPANRLPCQGGASTGEAGNLSAIFPYYPFCSMFTGTGNEKYFFQICVHSLPSLVIH